MLKGTAKVTFSKFLGQLWGNIRELVNILCQKENPTTIYCGWEPMAGETRFEHATYGFGDRYSTVEPLP